MAWKLGTLGQDPSQLLVWFLDPFLQAVVAIGLARQATVGLVTAGLVIAGLATVRKFPVALAMAIVAAELSCSARRYLLQ